MNEITKENEIVTFETGSLLARIISFLVDYAPIIFIISLWKSGVAEKITNILLFIWSGFTFVLTPLLFKGMTLGKKLLGLKVIPYLSFTTGIDSDFSFPMFILREIVKFFLSPAWFLNLIVTLLSKQKRGLHDFITCSIVVIAKPVPLTVKDYIRRQKQLGKTEDVTLSDKKAVAQKKKFDFKDLSKVANKLITFKDNLLKVVREEETGYRCPQCDNDIRKGQKICSNCGTEIDWED